MLVDVFTMSSTSTSLDKSPTILSFRIPLSGDKKLINIIFSAYNTFVKSTPAPKIGLVIDYEKGKVIDHSEILAQTVSLGGNITFSKGMCSTNAIKNSNKTPAVLINFYLEIFYNLFGWLCYIDWIYTTSD